MTIEKMETVPTSSSGLSSSVGSLPDRRPLLAFIFALVTFQGMTINLVPVAMGVVARSFPVSNASLGLLQSSFMAGGIFSLLISGYVTDFIRQARSATFAVATLVAGLLLLGSAISFFQVLVAAGLIGVGNFWILSAYSSVIADFFQE